MDPPALFGIITGGAVLWWSGSRIGLDWEAIDFAILLLFTAGSTLIYGGLYTALASLSFYTDSKTGILPLMWNIQNYGRYPVNIYNKLIRFVLTWILPFAFVGFYPAVYFINPSFSYLSWLTPIVGVVAMFGGIFVWNQGVKRYRGAGS
jgi:ABC-2 type transport system permease protein